MKLPAPKGLAKDGGVRPPHRPTRAESNKRPESAAGNDGRERSSMEVYILMLEEAIRAEGYEIRTDMEMGGVTLKKVIR